MKKILLFIIIPLLLLTGCADYNGLSELIFVDSMGIDYKDSEYYVYLHICNPNTLTTQEQGSSNVDVKYSIAKANGESIFSAMKNIKTYSNLEISLSILKSIILSTNLINKKGIESIINFFNTYPKIYPTFNVLTTNSSIENIYTTVNPKNLSPYFTLLGENLNNNFLPNKKYSQFISEYYEPNLTLTIPLLDTNNKIWSDENNNLTSSAIVGLLVYDKINDVEINLYIKDFPGLIYLFPFHNLEFELGDIIINIQKYEYKLKHQHTKLLVSAKIISTISSNRNKHENIYTILSNEITKDFYNIVDYLYDLDIDILQINEYFYRRNIDLSYRDVDIILDLNLST